MNVTATISNKCSIVHESKRPKISTFMNPTVFLRVLINRPVVQKTPGILLYCYGMSNDTSCSYATFSKVVKYFPNKALIFPSWGHKENE